MKRFIVLLLCLGVSIAALLLQLGANDSSLRFDQYVMRQLASVIGISAAVPENSFNTLALQLKEKENTLTQREEEIQNKELALAKQREGREKSDMLYVTVGGGVLLFLVLFNFYLDYRRRQSLGTTKTDTT